ncbi:MAG: hypothetical protein FWD25_10085 [Clostridia bacterium]|nr:hypothetical protein [Clostridia bacterium]
MKKTERLLHALAAFCMPVVPMLYLYARNANYLSLMQMMYVAAALCLISLLGYCAAKKICESCFVGLIFCLMLWFAFFAYGSMYTLIPLQHRFLLPGVFLLLFGLVALLCKYVGKRDWREPCVMIDIAVTVLFIWNSFSVIHIYINNAPSPSAKWDWCKTDFAVDMNLPSPNVYWLHCDGMLGFDAMKEYFGDPQAAFINDLESRDFVINREASFEAAHATAIAIPALMCPDFYDGYARAQIQTLRDTYQLALSANKAYAAFGGSALSEVRMRNEMVNAFWQKGYTTAVIDISYLYFLPGLDLYVRLEEEEHIIINMENNVDAKDIFAYGQAAELLDLLFRTTMISSVEAPLRNQFRRMHPGIPSSEEWAISPAGEVDVTKYIPSSDIPLYEKNLIIGLNEAFSLPSPRLVIGMIMITHSTFNNVRDYAPQHRYAAEYVISVVDFILENDPDAIVVLQSDHGLRPTAQVIMEQFSPTEEAVWDIWNSTMSAVRIPEKYGALAEPIDPLNISRYLVNHFVGENYAYLESENEKDAL